MPTVLPAKTRTWPDVVSMLVQRRWRWANIETTLVQNLCLLGSTQVFVCTQPSPSIIFSPADQGSFSKTAGQSQACYNTWNWEWGTYDVIHQQILTCEVAVSTAGSLRVWLINVDVFFNLLIKITEKYHIIAQFYRSKDDSFRSYFFVSLCWYMLSKGNSCSTT